MLTVYEIISLAWFLMMWFGYTKLCSSRSNDRFCLSKVLHEFRYKWMYRMLARVNRIPDMSAISSLEKNAGFFASSCMFIVAGLLGILASSKKSLDLLRSFDYFEVGTDAAWYAKITLLICIFVYCFFSFTWSMRQYGFCAILIGAAPTPEENIDEDRKSALAEEISNLLDLSGRHFNYGLRGFYFSLAVLAWFAGDLWFVLMTIIVVFVLYHREFKSTTLNELKKIHTFL